MAENSFHNVFDSLMKNIDTVVGSKTVIGDATVVGDATIVPLVDVSFGAAAGASMRDKKNGGVGGINAKVSPNAVLIIQNGHVKVVSVKDLDVVSKALDLIPEVIDKIKAMRDGGISANEAAKEAFPSDEA